MVIIFFSFWSFSIGTQTQQTECGSAFTSKLEGMFKDIDLSRDLMATYSQHLRTKLDDDTVFRLQRSREMDMHVQVRFFVTVTFVVVVLAVET